MVAALSLAACTASSSTAPSPQPSTPAGVSVLADESLGDAPEAAPVAVEERAPIVRLVTLGDAYTHGTETAAPRRDSWPAQLVESLDRDGVQVVLRNLAEPGDTSGELLEEQLGQVESLRPDVITLQVGVNDIVARETAWYRQNVAVILDELLTILPADRILTITTPDHTLTEWGDKRAGLDKGQATVAELNATLREEAHERGIEVVDIGQVNDLVAADPDLVVQHDPPLPYPTAKQYAGWAELIGPYVRDAISAIEP